MCSYVEQLACGMPEDLCHGCLQNLIEHYKEWNWRCGMLQKALKETGRKLPKDPDIWTF